MPKKSSVKLTAYQMEVVMLRAREDFIKRAKVDGERIAQLFFDYMDVRVFDKTYENFFNSLAFWTNPLWGDPDGDYVTFSAAFHKVIKNIFAIERMIELGPMEKALLLLVRKISNGEVASITDVTLRSIRILGIPQDLVRPPKQPSRPEIKTPANRFD